MNYARKLFDAIPDQNVFLWNAMLKGYADNNSHREVVFLFREFKRSDMVPNCFTFPIILKSCMGIDNALIVGEQMHCDVIKSGFQSNPFVGTTLIDMYAAGKVIGAAYSVFRGMVERNVVAWTAMINSFFSCGDVTSARSLFDLAPERDTVLWNTMISGYIGVGDIAGARELFDKMPNRDVMMWNTMLNGYANVGDVETCERLFENFPQRNVFSWNGLIGGYARSKRYFEVLNAFKRMLTAGDVVPNDATLVTVLSACARLGALDLGKWIHVYADNIGYRGNLFVGNALVDMYAKCGVVEHAVDMFKSMNEKDLISWNTIIRGLAMHGFGNDALVLFQEMKNIREKPDAITFLGVLCACTHMGCVEDGFMYFRSMVDDYLIAPEIEHYGCMVDLLSRAGHLDQAFDFVRKMPIAPDAVIWATLLGASRVYKNVQLAELALEQLSRFEPKNPTNYVVLSNLYGDLGRWNDVARLKLAMRDTGFKKLPGVSLIEVDDNVVEFYSFDERHRDSEILYGALIGLTRLLRSYGYVPELVELGHGQGS
ncbi:pentatricopeptide repeat-containing protein [Tripterygium wilfordii]|uniref:Pentatricopeptide repeat-containing protein n=1 Tax=Tripterygium wilfordii TaxID=458696 RepID=A0A7J7DG01_TRIWF|nr:pentatricopeptide repeat-containing protein At1g08070, chloroplastic-like [Tripterygium wilfordii]XP_038706597.1 pentatricopeptide repeat-containing protein At1g08070, chloroplastic-like [Tripterygium wilfordii]XP_038706598.1 pentatricopeptide repeat-containing protein At1g08070, chloroplastic-like [Tripterygium wilfordii]KAF5745262.1 pentatricopeptide repeat-containing protein [Tripterygium wilfordii]